MQSHHGTRVSWKALLRLLVGLVLPLAAYTAWAVRLDARLRPFGDEGAYLLLAHSLAFDGDVDLRNNLEATPPEFAAPVGPPVADYRGDGRLRALQNVGLPLLLALPYRFGGILGARLAIAACATLLWATLVRIAERVAGDRTAATIAVALVGLTIPVLPFAGTIWTEIPAATISALSCWLALRERPPSVATLLGAGGLLAFLPWLHVRYFALAIPLLLWLSARSRPLRRRSALCLLLPQAVSCALLLAVFRHLYGSPWPGAPYRASFGWPWFVWSAPHIYRGLVGLFLDQEFGLLFYAPYLVAGIAGLFLLKHQRGLAGALAGMLVGLALPASAFAMWWGGDSPPARLILPVVPLLAVPLARAIAALRCARFRAPFALLALWSLLLTGLYVRHPDWLPSEDGDRLARPLEEFGWVPQASLFPSTAVKTIDYGAAGLACQAGAPRALDGHTLWYVSADAPPGSCVQRLSLVLPRGNHRIAVRMRVVPAPGAGDGPLVRLRVLGSDGNILTQRQIGGADIPAQPGWADYELRFSTATNTAATFELEREGRVELWIERTRVEAAGRWPDLGQAAAWASLFAGLGVCWAMVGPAAPDRQPLRHLEHARSARAARNLPVWSPRRHTECPGQGGTDAA